MKTQILTGCLGGLVLLAGSGFAQDVKHDELHRVDHAAKHKAKHAGKHKAKHLGKHKAKHSGKHKAKHGTADEHDLPAVDGAMDDFGHGGRGARNEVHQDAHRQLRKLLERWLEVNEQSRKLESQHRLMKQLLEAHGAALRAAAGKNKKKRPQRDVLGVGRVHAAKAVHDLLARVDGALKEKKKVGDLHDRLLRAAHDLHSAARQDKAVRDDLLNHSRHRAGDAALKALVGALEKRDPKTAKPARIDSSIRGAKSPRRGLSGAHSHADLRAEVRALRDEVRRLRKLVDQVRTRSKRKIH